jgi:general secretion pathway protein A
MYKEYFGLKERPFSIAPDPRYLYMSRHHQEALAHLLYGIQSGGFVLLTGDVGTGKTTISRCLLEQMPGNTDVAFILNPKMTVHELLATFCDELVINYPEGNTSVKVFVDRINEYLLDAYARGRRTVLIIEEAQNLSMDVLEQIRLLTNLETHQDKLLQIIMIGQPELREMLSRPEMAQLSQRVTARYHIGPLSAHEVGAYVQHRLAVAGAGRRLFQEEAVDRLYRMSRGIPRLINVICDRALLGAYAQGKEHVDKATLVNATREVFGQHKGLLITHVFPKWLLGGISLMFLIAVLTTFVHFRMRQADTEFPDATLAAANATELEWKDEGTIQESKALAYQALFRNWGIPFPQVRGGNACRQARMHALRCLNGSGGFQKLVLLNRPAVLKLFDGKGRIFYAALVSLRQKNAELILGEKQIIVERSQVEKHWLGDYEILWKPPPGFRANIHPGHRGETIRWLNIQLAALQEWKPQHGNESVYHEDLVAQVKRFQLSHGLVPDGIIGPHTVILLQTAAHSGNPLLVHAKEAG